MMHSSSPTKNNPTLTPMLHSSCNSSPTMMERQNSRNRQNRTPRQLRQQQKQQKQAASGHLRAMSASTDCVQSTASGVASMSVGGSNNSKSVRSLRAIVERIAPGESEGRYAKRLKQFCDSTSAHGFHKLFESSSQLHRAAWLLIIVAAVTGFTIHLSFLVSRFLQSPVNTETRVYNTPFVFPDVTVCSTGHMSKLRYSQNPVISSVNVTLQELIADVSRFWGAKNSSDDSVNADLRNSLKSFLHELNVTKQRQDAIIHCLYAGASCSYRDFHQVSDPEYFSCFTFSPPSRSLIVGGEKDGGLSLILYTGDDKNFITEEESLSFSTGYRVIVHPTDTRPDSADGFYIQNGSSTHVQLAYTSLTVLSKGSRKCARLGQLPDSEFLDMHTGRLLRYRYSVSDCAMRHCQAYLNTTCHCLSELLPVPADYGPQFRTRFCHRVSAADVVDANDGTAAVAEWELRARRECHDSELELIHRRTAGNLDSCPVPCDGQQYDLRLTQNRWPGHPGEAGQALLDRVRASIRLADQDRLDTRVLHTVERRLLSTTRGSGSVGGSFVRLSIYSHSTMGNRVAEAWAYPAGNLFSDIGGILGLWLGVSLISTFEFFELFADLVTSARRKAAATRSAAIVEQNDLAVL